MSDIAKEIRALSVNLRGGRPEMAHWFQRAADALDALTAQMRADTAEKAALYAQRSELKAELATALQQCAKVAARLEAVERAAALAERLSEDAGTPRDVRAAYWDIGRHLRSALATPSAQESRGALAEARASVALDTETRVCEPEPECAYCGGPCRKYALANATKGAE